jgi:hypothetical protein
MSEELTTTLPEEKPLRDEHGRFVPGHPGNSPGRPKGSITIKGRIKQILEEDPKRFEELCKFYLDDKKMRDLLWKMIDGMPKEEQQVVGDLTIKWQDNGPANSNTIQPKSEPSSDTQRSE